MNGITERLRDRAKMAAQFGFALRAIEIGSFAKITSGPARLSSLMPVRTRLPNESRNGDAQTRVNNRFGWISSSVNAAPHQFKACIPVHFRIGLTAFESFGDAAGRYVPDSIERMSLVERKQRGW